MPIDAGLGVARVAADLHVEVAAVARAEPLESPCSRTAAGACSVPPARPTESIGTPITTQ